MHANKNSLISSFVNLQLDLTSAWKPAVFGWIVVKEGAYVKGSLLNGSKASRTCVHHLLTYVLDFGLELVILCETKDM